MRDRLAGVAHSASTSSSARASIASANLSRARLRSAGVASRQVSKAAAAAAERGVHVRRAGDRRLQVGLAGARVDDALVAPSAGRDGSPPTKFAHAARRLRPARVPPARVR